MPENQSAFKLPPIELILSRFPDAKQHGASYRARCPAHGGDNPTALSISEIEGGTVLLHCFGHGCTADAITSSVGLELADLFPATHPRRQGNSRLRLVKPKTPIKPTDAEKILLPLVTTEIMGLLWGPLPDTPQDAETITPYGGLTETLWDVYTDGGHDAVLGAWVNLRASLEHLAPKLLVSVDRRCKDLGKQGYDTKPRPPLATYRAHDLQGKTFPARQWVIPDMISEGVMVLAGPSGLGKSWFALQLAMAVAYGGKAFSAFDVEPGEVLYCSFEDDERSMQERLDTLEDGATWPEDLHILHAAPRLDQGLVTDLDTWLKSHTRARLIIIDVLKHIRPPRQSKGDWYEQDYAIAEALKPLASTYHVAIILLHHCNKLAKPEDPLDAISGSTGLVGPADMKAVFARGRGNADAKLFLTGRTVRERWLAFEFRECIWTYLGPAQAVERTKTRQAIIDAMEAYPGAMTAKAITQGVAKQDSEISPSLVRYTLRKMLDADELRQPARGWYSIPLTNDSLHTQHLQNKQGSQDSQTQKPDPVVSASFTTEAYPPKTDPVVSAPTDVCEFVSPDSHATHNLQPASVEGQPEFVSFVSIVRDEKGSREVLTLEPDAYVERCPCGYTFANKQRVCIQCRQPRDRRA